MDNGMGDGGEALHEWMFHEGGHRGEVLEDLLSHFTFRVAQSK